MHAVTIASGELRWVEQPDPEPGAGEILVRVRAAGVNAADLLQQRGLYPAPPGSPADIPGLEVAGEVAARGRGAGRFALGDRVMAVVGGGAHAELLAVHERTAMRVPAKVEWDRAGGFPETFTTAWDALFAQCGLSIGDRVLVHGAAGGVGTAAVQLAAAAGADVTATVRDPALRGAVAGLGAAHVIAPDAFADSGPFDIVVELVGAPNIADDLAVLATGGRIVVIGVGAGAGAQVNLLALMSKRAVLRGSTLRARPLEDKAAAAVCVEHHVVPLLGRGQLGVPIAATYPMADAVAAYERFAAGAKFGKVVLLAG